ncbi:MAG: hypothetical protein Q8O89_06430 [Nanoarchaeota archaeon]|nr:hypothetical protein [Nanoarchaeota archaeon]
MAVQIKQKSYTLRGSVGSTTSTTIQISMPTTGMLTTITGLCVE